MPEQLEFSIIEQKKRGRPKGSKNKSKKVESLHSSNEEQGSCKAEVTGSSPVEGSEPSRLDKLEKSIELLTTIVTKLVDQKALEREQAEQLLKETAKSVKEKLENTGEKKVRVNVKPEININGATYCGIVEVPESLAHRLKAIMSDREAMKAKEPIFVDHGVKKLAELKGHE